MAKVAEYDGYLEFDNDQIRESFIQLNENVRNLEKKIEASEGLITTLQNEVNVLNTSTTVTTGGSGIWEKLKTWNVTGTESEIVFEDTDGAFNSSYSQYMIIGEGLKPSADASHFGCVMSVNGDYKQWEDSSPVHYYSYFGYHEDGSSFDTFGAANQYHIALSDFGGGGVGGDANRAETLDFTAYLTAPRTTGRPTKLRWWLTCETDTSSDFHGEMRNVVGWGKFSTSTSGPSYGFNPIDGIKFVFIESMTDEAMTFSWGKISFFGLVGH